MSNRKYDCCYWKGHAKLVVGNAHLAKENELNVDEHSEKIVLFVILAHRFESRIFNQLRRVFPIGAEPEDEEIANCEEEVVDRERVKHHTFVALVDVN